MEREVIELGGPSVFSIDEANSRVRVILRFTREVSKLVDRLLAQLEALDPQDTVKSKKLEAQVEELIEAWNNKVRKLGAEPKGLWLADFNSGDGYYCWKFPETQIQFWHDRNSGFTGRISLQEREKRLISKLTT